MIAIIPTRCRRCGPARTLVSGLLWVSALGPLALTNAEAATPAAPSATAVPSAVWHSARDLAAYALGLIGVDYRFGGTTPERGLDCSGLVRYVFQQVTGVTLPRTSQELSRIGDKVSLADLEPGDLVFFNTRRLQFSHVGIYIGEDRFIHAPRRGGEVEIVTLSREYWRKHFDGARRLVGALPDLIPTAEAAAIETDTGPGTKPPGEGASAIDVLALPENLQP